MTIYYNGHTIVAETGGEAAGKASHEYASLFAELYKKTGKAYKTDKVVSIKDGIITEVG